LWQEWPRDNVEVMTMNAKLADEIETLRRTAQRLERAGLVVDRATLSREHRRALFALQCLVCDQPEPEAGRARIGFAYPHER
jgi:hypothetical protein